MSDSNLHQIPSEGIRKAISKTIEKRLKSDKHEVICSSASKGGENNFCGVIYRVSFNETSDRNGTKSSFIVKLAPQNVSRRIQFHSREMFLQEIVMYREVLPAFRHFELVNGVNCEMDGFIEYPKCYRTIDEEPTECLVLEDLCIRGFSDIDRCTEEVTADHVCMIMGTLGKFHAISLAMKDQQPEKFNELATKLKDVFIRTDVTLFVKYFDKVSKNTLNIFDGEDDKALLAKVEKLFAKGANDILADCFDLKVTGSALVISHGDAWQNNVMFRYDENRTPIEVRFLDWQIPCYSSPVIDIVYFIFCCTTKNLRDTHYDDFLAIYHESLSAHLRRLCSDPEKLFPYEMMQEHLHKCGKYGLILATIILPMLATEKGNGLNLDGMADSAGNNADMEIFDAFLSHSQHKYKQRLRDITIDMARLGYI